MTEKNQEQQQAHEEQLVSEEELDQTVPISEEEIAEALTEAGLSLVAVYGENSFEAPREDSQRNIYITRRI